MASRMFVKRNAFLTLVVFGSMVGLLLPPLATVSVASRSLSIRVTDLLLIWGGLALLLRGNCARGSLDVHLVAQAFLLWTMATSFWSVDPLRTCMYSMYLFEAYLAFVVAWEFFSTSDNLRFRSLLRIFDVVLIGQVAWAVWLAYQKVGLNPFGWKQYLTVPMGGSNFVALFLEFIGIYELALAAPGWPFFAGVTALALVATLSRGGMISFGFGLMLWMGTVVFRRRWLTWKRVVGLVLMFGAVLYGLLRLSIPLQQWFGLIGHSFSERASLASEALNAFEQFPFTGVGFAAFGSWAGTYQRAPHNLLVQLLSETGIIGTSLFLVLLLVLGLHLLRAHARGRASGESREVLAVSLGLAVLLVHSLGEPFFLDGISGVWVAIIVAWFLTVPHGLQSAVVRGKTT